MARINANKTIPKLDPKVSAVHVPLDPFTKSYQQLLLYHSGKIYVDHLFPTGMCSLICDPVKGDEQLEMLKKSWQDYLWFPATSLMSMYDDEDNCIKLFQNDINPFDIKNGELNNYYFLSALQVLAEEPDRIYKLFMEKEINSSRIFGVKLIKGGEE